MEMKIYGRHREKLLLDRLLASPNAEFIALWGRRRIGKTYLIDNGLCSKADLCMTVTGQKDQNQKRQLDLLRQALARAFFNGADLPLLHSWDDAFKAIIAAVKNNASHSKNIVIFLDELPWLAGRTGKLVAALDHAWNTELKNISNLRLVICGSAASWFVKKIVRDRGGLHNRLTCKMRLNPFSLSDVEEYLTGNGISMNRVQIVELYLALGGVPFYLNFVQKGESPQQAISRILFADGPLANEFNDLFHALFDDGEAHLKLVKVLSTKRRGLLRSDIIKITKFNGGYLTKKLDELSEAGFIGASHPYKGKKDAILYRIIDPFLLFHLKWIESSPPGVLNQVDKNIWYKYRQTPSYEAWAGYSFENICYLHLHAIAKFLGLDHVLFTSGTWEYRSQPVTRNKKFGRKLNPPPMSEDIRGAQIDLLFDREDQVISLCEIKYCENPFVITKDYAEVLERKRNIFKKITKSNKVLHLVIIATHGVTDNEYSRKLIQRVVSLDDLWS